jgi:hypothetical protein
MQDTTDFPQKQTFPCNASSLITQRNRARAFIQTDSALRAASSNLKKASLSVTGTVAAQRLSKIADGLEALRNPLLRIGSAFEARR